jgi:WD40 repeat protein
MEGWGHRHKSPRRLAGFVDGNNVFLASLNNDEQPSLLGAIEPNNGAYVLIFTPDDARVFAGSINGDIHQWEVKTGRVLSVVKSFGGTIDSITFNSQLKSMTVTANSYVSEFDAAGEDWILGFRREIPHAYGFTEGYYRQARAFSENGIIFTNRGPGQRMSGGPTDGITALDFSPDGRWLATGSESGEIVLWETGTWRKNRSWRGHPTMIRHLAFSHLGNSLAAADDNYAALWDVETGKELRSLKQWLFKKSLVFSPDDKWLAVNAVGKPSTPIYDVASGELALELPGRPRGEMAFSPDGKLLVGAASAETLHVWDIQKKTVTMKLGPRTSSDLDVLFHPDGRRVLTSGTGLAVRVWDLAAQKEVLALTDPAGPGRPTNIALSADGTLVAAGFRDGAARLWELETGKLLQVFQLGPRSGIVDDVSFSPDGGYLATLNRNGTVYVLSLDGVSSG